jgi:hypothetical protein
MRQSQMKVVWVSGLVRMTPTTAERPSLHFRGCLQRMWSRSHGRPRLRHRSRRSRRLTRRSLGSCPYQRRRTLPALHLAKTGRFPPGLRRPDRPAPPLRFSARWERPFSPPRPPRACARWTERRQAVERGPKPTHLSGVCCCNVACCGLLERRYAKVGSCYSLECPGSLFLTLD